MHRYIFFLLLSFGLLHGCQGTKRINILEPPVISENPNRDAPLAAIVRFQTDRPVSTILSITDGAHTWELEYAANMNPACGLPVIGMRPNRHHTITVTVRDSSGEELQISEPLSFTTPPLPAGPDDFPNFIATQHKPDIAEPGYTLLNPRRMIPQNISARELKTSNNFGQNFGLLTIVDDNGEVLWYYRSDKRIADLQYLKNGHILYTNVDNSIVELDLLGNIVAAWYAVNRPDGPGDGIAVDALTLHHDLDMLPNGNILALNTERRMIDNYYTTDIDATAPRKNQWVMGDCIIEFERSGRIIWSWNAFDYLDPMRIGYETFVNYWIRRGFPEPMDWSHANGLEYIAEENSLLVNFRIQSCIVKINRNTGNILWIFGEPSGWPVRLSDKLITLKNGRCPWHQHSPVITSRGTLLLFDNGNYQARPFSEPAPIAETHSRVVEYRIDEETMTAEEIWTSEIPGDKKVVSFAMGSVQQLPQTGNILAGYGMLLPNDKIDQLTWDTRNRFSA